MHIKELIGYDLKSEIKNGCVDEDAINMSAYNLMKREMDSFMQDASIRKFPTGGIVQVTTASDTLNGTLTIDDDGIVVGVGFSIK